VVAVDIYIMQHGEAMSADVDPERPLSDLGRASVRAVAGHAAACGIRIDRIVHSGKLRAEQTAALLAAALGCDPVDRVDGLKPSDSVELAVRALASPDRSGSLAVVGHLPFLERFASLLVAGDPAARVVALRNGGLVKLVPAPLRPGHDPRGAYSVAWVLTPELARP
jgi:phosphohistidine phosphatase